MTEQILVSVDRLSRRYGDVTAVAEVSFELRRGEILGFLGANGAGKSTTMNMLCGVLAPSSGRIRIAGHDIVRQPLAAKQALGYLPEQPPLYRDLTVDEYLDYCARLRRLEGSQRRQRLLDVKQRCGLTEVGKRLIGQLSKGYQQRVGIAQAIIHRPPLIVLDEPTVGLDPMQIREIRALIRELGEDHGVILSTHILPEVQVLCDRVQIIDHGRIVFADTLAALEARKHAAALRLRLRGKADEDRLAAIDGVVSVTAIDEHGWRLLVDPANHPVERIAEYAVSNGLGLQELASERFSLEQVFVDITMREPKVES